MKINLIASLSLGSLCHQHLVEARQPFGVRRRCHSTRKLRSMLAPLAAPAPRGRTLGNSRRTAAATLLSRRACVYVVLASDSTSAWPDLSSLARRECARREKGINVRWKNERVLGNGVVYVEGSL